ncbi:hypothetical protein J3454_11470 [Erythrobacter sp. NFXS35]|uniref:hypothetical protein n=1 Tax=Erythrobacter sp. NFXS35 TaxID=2818436 RepID=UPI0032DEBF94
MSHGLHITAKVQRKLPMLTVCGVLALALPSAGWALADKSVPSAATSIQALGLNVFTPASVDPELAARVADKARAHGIRFTPAGATPVAGERTVTVAVRVDSEEARAISVRKAIDAVPGRGAGLSGLEASRFQLGTARGYKSFARPIELPSQVRRMELPDLAQFEPSRPKADNEPSRLQPRIELEDREIAGRSPNTLDAIGAQTVGVGGSFRLSPNLNVTAGVRYSQERERLDPLTNSVQDSQAVYVGTQIKF